MGVDYNPSIVIDGLVGCWDVASPRSSPGEGTTWTDLSKNGNNGTLTNGPITAEGINKGIISFDGTDDEVVTVSNVDITGDADRTLCVWYYHNSRNVLHLNIIGYGSQGDGQIFDIMSRYDNGYDRVVGHFYGVNYDTLSSLPSRSTTNYLEWNYVCVTKEGTLVSVYSNGEFSNSVNLTLNTSNSPLRIGKGTWGNSTVNNYSGMISSVHMYNRALTAAEIKQNYNATKGRFSVTPSIVKENLVLHLDAGDSDSYPGTGTTWSDLTPNGHDFSLINGPVYSSDGGGSIAFDGTNDLALMDSTTNVDNVLSATLEIWTRIDSLPVGSTSEIIYAHKYGISHQTIRPSLIWNIADSRVEMTVKFGAGPEIINTTSLPWVSGVWYHIVAAHDTNGDEVLYRDGVSVATADSSDGTSTGYISTQQKRLGIGCGTWETDHLEGAIAVVRFYKNKALSATEALQNYEAQKGRFV